MAEATARVAAGDLSVRVDPGAGDEVGELVNSFNSMVAELEANRARIVYLQKISAWQEMARRLAHEIKNPLTPIHLAAQQLKEKYRADAPDFGRLLEQSTEIIEEEVATLRRLTADFSAFAKLPEIKTERVDLGEFVGECQASLASYAEREGVSLVFSPVPPGISVELDRIMMKRVVDNLVRNAVEALGSGAVDDPQVVLSVEQRPKEVELCVQDNGPGILSVHHPSIFEPYFTTKSEGTGLGLAICKKIVLDHGGRIWIEEGAGGGAVFIVALRRAEPGMTRS
jgi:nitrogen fixation/metabolism regulation signal transduction histidine kinase